MSHLFYLAQIGSHLVFVSQPIVGESSWRLVIQQTIGRLLTNVPMEPVLAILDEPRVVHFSSQVELISLFVLFPLVIAVLLCSFFHFSRGLNFFVISTRALRLVDG